MPGSRKTQHMIYAKRSALRLSVWRLDFFHCTVSKRNQAFVLAFRAKEGEVPQYRCASYLRSGFPAALRASQEGCLILRSHSVGSFRRLISFVKAVR